MRPRYTADRDVEMSLMRCKAVGAVGGKHPVRESSQERSEQCDLPVICKGMHSLALSFSLALMSSRLLNTLSLL